MTPVRRNASGSRMDRSTCDSAAKLTMASASATSGSDDRRIGDVAADEAQPIRQRRVRADRVEVRFVARVGELVEDRDRRPVAPGQDVADVAGADEPGSARDQQPPEGAVRHAIGQPTGRVDGRVEPALGVVRGRQLGRPQQRRHGPGVRPVAVVDLGEQAAARDVVVEDVGDLELAATRRRQSLDDVEHVRPEEVHADRDEVALGLGRLLLEPDDPTVRSRTRRRRTAAGPGPGTGACRRRTDPPRRPSATSASLSPRRMLSPRTTQNASSPTKSRARPMAWAIPSAPG